MYLSNSSSFIHHISIIHAPNLLVTNQVRPLSQTFNYQIMALDPTIDILHIISRGLEMGSCVVALGNEDVVIHAAF